MPTKTRSRMLEATAALVQRQGFHGTSLNAVLGESSAPRGSLYHHFPGGKEELVLEATRRRIERVTAFLEELLRGEEGPAVAVRAFARAAAEEQRASGYALGCPVAPILLDLEPGSKTELAEACRAALADWRRLLGKGFRAAGIAAPRSRTLALTVVSAVEGALLLARAERRTTPLDAVAEELFALVGSAQPG